jgi:site-specific DNA-methyltransferase (adenine-specific)
MCAPNFEVPHDPNVLLHLADCFDITADGISLLQDAFASQYLNGVNIDDCLDLVGKAQIALRAAVSHVNNRPDNDQHELFLIIREAAGHWHQYIPLNGDGDSPTAGELPALRERIATMQVLLEQGRVFQERLAIVKEQVDANPHTTAQWLVVSNHVSRLVDEGMAPSNIQLREILLPTFEAIPECDEFNPKFNLVLREIDMYLESRPEIDDTLDQDEPTAEVLQVRNLLEGRKMLLIGGSHRPAAKQKLKDAFALQDAVVNRNLSMSSYQHAQVFKSQRWTWHDEITLTRNGKRYPATHRRYGPCEKAFVFSKGRPNTINMLRDRPNKWAGTPMHGNVRKGDKIVPVRSSVIKPYGFRLGWWQYSGGGRPNDVNGDHPARMPEKMAEDLILSYSNPGDVVFDPMCGSGTTCKMALLNRRLYVGTEIHQPYVEIARERLRLVRRQRLGVAS